MGTLVIMPSRTAPPPLIEDPADRCVVQVHLVVCRHEDGSYNASVWRMAEAGDHVAMVPLPTLSEIPQHALRPTWLMNEALQLAYADPEAYGLLAW